MALFVTSARNRQAKRREKVGSLRSIDPTVPLTYDFISQDENKIQKATFLAMCAARVSVVLGWPILALAAPSFRASRSYRRRAEVESRAVVAMATYLGSFEHTSTSRVRNVTITIKLAVTMTNAAVSASHLRSPKLRFRSTAPFFRCCSMKSIFIARRYRGGTSGLWYVRTLMVASPSLPGASYYWLVSCYTERSINCQS